jgi:hypothetical protein
MKRQTFERALHSWPEWHNSINKSREFLGYNPKWPETKCISWIEKHYNPEIRGRARSELERMGLPPTLREYWEDCLYSDYVDKTGKINYSRITRRLLGVKSLPELPYDHGMVWHENENVDNPWLRVEIRIHERFVTRELFNDAAEFAYEAVQSHLSDRKVKPHPVCTRLKGGRPPVDPDIAVECARLRDDEGWTYKQIGVKFGWSLEPDSYGNLSQCNTARYYVKLGKTLRNQTNTNNKPSR